MNKLINYLKNAKNRGFLFVFILIFVSGLLVAAVTRQIGNQWIQSAAMTKLIDSVPTFSIKDGAIQEPNIRFATMIAPQVPFVIDSSVETLPAALPNGLYLTKNALFMVSDNGTRLDKTPLTEDMIVSPDTIRQALRYGLWGVFAITLILWVVFAVAFYFITLLFTMLFAKLLALDLGNHKAWRVTSLTFVVPLVALYFVSIFTANVLFNPLFVVMLLIATNVVILSKLQK